MMEPTAAPPEYRIGIDLGGTKIAAILMDQADNTMREDRIATPRDDYAATLAAIASLVAGFAEIEGGDTPVGIAMPGSIDPRAGLVQNANSVWLNGKPLQEDLEARLDRPLKLANDANCFALSEATDGAAEGAATVFGVILGTGCGGGIVVAVG